MALPLEVEGEEESPPVWHEFGDYAFLPSTGLVRFKGHESAVRMSVRQERLMLILWRRWPGGYAREVLAGLAGYTSEPSLRMTISKLNGTFPGFIECMGKGFGYRLGAEPRGA